MNKKLLFFLCNIMVMGYASERSSCPVPFLDMCTIENQRIENQDRRAFCRLPNKGLFFGVLDGHCSSEVADHMSCTFPNSFYRYLQNSSEECAFNNAFRDADSYALDNLRGGSAALFVYVNNGIAHIANVGDSRAVLGNNNQVAFVTQDQTPDRKDEYERIMKAGGIVYRQKGELGTFVGPWRVNGLAMSRAVGDKYCKGRDQNRTSLCLLRANVEVKGQNSGNRQIEITPKIGQVIGQAEYTQLPLTNEHRWLIIASDGLWDAVKNKEALILVQDYYDKNDTIKGVSTFLSDYAIHNGSEDNITVLVIDLLDQIQSKK